MDRQIDGEKDGKMNKPIDRQTNKGRNEQTNRLDLHSLDSIGLDLDYVAYIRLDRSIDAHTDKWTDKQIDRQVHGDMPPYIDICI